MDQLEARFGGKLQDKKSEFFPPDMASAGENMISMAEFTQRALEA